MADNVYDAIVVGSGISGGWAAKELTEKGLKVIMLERGRNIEHIKDYVNATKEIWEFPHRGGATQKMIEEYPVLKRDYPLNETNLDYWVKDKESPYTEIKRFDWFRGYHVGGRSLMWGSKVIVGVIWILKQMQKKDMVSTGQSAIKILRHGIAMLKNLRESVVQRKD